MTKDSTLKQKTYSNQSVVRTYFKFNFKYLIKRKSTWLSPLIFFLLLGIGIIVMRIINGPTTNIVAFQTLMAVFSVVFFAILGIVKGVNLFREPTTEGVEILIVSKPLERWQILVVKFSVFNLYGLFLFVLNSLLFIIFSAIMGINVNQYLISGLGIPLGNWFSYLFFGTVSVLLSIKFSSKLVMGLGITLAIFSNIFATSFNLIVGAFLTSKNGSFNDVISKDINKYNNPGPGVVFSGTQAGQEPKFFLSQNEFFGSSFGVSYGDTQRNINLKKLYDQQTANELVNIWNQGKDSWWVGQLFTFINPTAAFGKISSLGNFGKLSNTIFGRSGILNEIDFSWSAQINNRFSTWNDASGTNYSLVGVDLSNPFSFRDDFGVWTPIKKIILNLGTINEDFGSNASLVKGFYQNKSIDNVELTYEMINDKRNTLENLINKELANVTSANEAINKIQSALSNGSIINNDFDQTFFDKFRNDWDYVDMANINPDQSLIPGAKWTLDPKKQAEFIYYLAQIVAVNDAFNSQNNDFNTTNKFRLEAQKIQNLDQANSEMQFRFFGERFNTRIIQSNQLKMIELVPTERTPIWALIFLWFSIIILFNGLTIFLYFRKDFQ